MSRGGSFGGGQSSLGYLFESDEMPHDGSSKGRTKPPKPPSDDDGKKAKGTTISNTNNPLAAGKPINNNYHRAEGQNAGNFITGRPSTKVQSVPGGDSSLGYLFGGK